MRRFSVAALVAVAALTGAPSSVSAMVLAEVGSFERPTYVTSDPADPNRLFVVEQAGRIKLIENGTTPPTFLDIAHLVHPLNATGDYGTFSIAFSPNYAEDGLFYVTYSGVDDPNTAGDETGDWHLDEFRAEGDAAVPSSRRAVLTIEFEPTLGVRGHYGGQLQLGPDGYLYASTGDGDGLPQGDPNGNAQNLELLFGKILRIDPQGSAPGEYTVPVDNPFADTTSCSDGCDEIWSYGLRHPWRFSFDRLTGDLAIGDVGWHDWEEVNFSTGPDPGKGDNFGWNCREGAHPGPGETSVPPADVCTAGGTFTEPVFEYAHDPACSVTGGYVVRDPALGDLYGRYLYADFCVGELRSLELGLPMAAGDRSEGLTVPRPTSFGEDAIGRIYVASFEGPVYRLEPDCDNDGLGDESQDSDLSACAPAPPGAGSGPLGAAPGTSGAASSSHFDLAKLKRNQKKGIAHVAFDLPGPGAVGLKGNGLVRIRLGPGLARESRAVAGGRVWLKVAPAKKGKRARRIRETLERKGKATVRFRVTYVPTGGVAATQSKRLKLKKR